MFNSPIVDAYDRTITYLRLSLTAQCNLRCVYCMPCGHPSRDEITDDEVVRLVQVMTKLGMTKLRLTGGEPLVRPGIIDLIKRLKNETAIEEIVLTTNGIRLKEMAKPLFEAGVKRLNISLDTLEDKTYQQITGRDQLQTVLQGIQAAKEAGFDPIKLNVVLQKGINEHEIKAFIDLTKTQCEVRFIELMAIGDAIDYAKHYFLDGQAVQQIEPKLIAGVVKDPHSPATYYTLPDAAYQVGIIRPISCGFCENCNRIRVTADRKLRLCLHSDEELDLTEALHDKNQIEALLRQAIKQKPKAHHLEEAQYCQNRGMSEIGG